MIKIISGANGITRVFQDGNEINQIKEVRFSHSALDKQPTLLLLFAEDRIEIDAAILPELPDFYKPFYEKKSELNKEPASD